MNKTCNIIASPNGADKTTLSGLSYVKKIAKWQKMGYKVILMYFSLPFVEIAIDRVRSRVKKGGHNIPEQDIRRRFERSNINLETVFIPIVDEWVIFDTSGGKPKLIRASSHDTRR